MSLNTDTASLPISPRVVTVADFQSNSPMGSFFILFSRVSRVPMNVFRSLRFRFFSASFCPIFSIASLSCLEISMYSAEAWGVCLCSSSFAAI